MSTELTREKRSHPQLENCQVLGIVAADRELVIEDSLCYTFRPHGGGEYTGEPVLLPQAIVDPWFAIAEPFSVIGLPISNEDATEIELDDDDRVNYDEQIYLTIADRVPDLAGIEDRIDTLEAMFQDAADGAETAPEGDLREMIGTAQEVEEERLP